MMDKPNPVRLLIPNSYRCAVALTFDTDMAQGYSPPDNPLCHGRTEPFVAERMRTMMDTAEQYGARLHWFKIANGLEDGNDWSVYEEALQRGHQVDSHTYSHLNLAHTAPEELNEDLRRANELLKKRLGIDPVILRGPGGYVEGALTPKNQKVILDNGFKYVSGEFNTYTHYKDNLMAAVREPSERPVYRYSTGLVEIPIHGWTDRIFFDALSNHPEALNDWRKHSGHKPVAKDWICPWTESDSLEKFIAFHKKMFDFIYEEKLFMNFCSHPYSFYLHDRNNIFLKEILTYIRAKSEQTFIGTLRDIIKFIIVDGT